MVVEEEEGVKAEDTGELSAPPKKPARSKRFDLKTLAGRSAPVDYMEVALNFADQFNDELGGIEDEEEARAFWQANHVRLETFLAALGAGTPADAEDHQRQRELIFKLEHYSSFEGFCGDDQYARDRRSDFLIDCNHYFFIPAERRAFEDALELQER